MYPSVPGVPERIAQVIPSVRLIYLLRDPIDRIRSHYLQHAGMGQVGAPIDKEVLSNPVYVETSMYAMQLDRYLAHFDRDQILVLKVEDLWSDPQPQMDRVCDFLSIKSHFDERWVHYLNPASARQYPYPLIGALRWSRVGRAVAGSVPTKLKHRVVHSRLTTTSEPMWKKRSTMSPNVRKALVERLRPDLDRLKGYLGPDFDCWGLI
jgi:hypothetical protein